MRSSHGYGIEDCMVRNSDAGNAAEHDVTALKIVVRAATGDDFF